MNKAKSVLAVSVGEPAGIGPELVIKAALQRPDIALLAVANRELLDSTIRKLGVSLALQPELGENDDYSSLYGGLYVFDQTLGANVTPGSLNPLNARYVLSSLDAAVDLCGQRGVEGLVTAPIHKGVINDGGVAFSGHTERLAELAGVKRVVMMLSCPGLRVALVTTHLPLREVADAVTEERVLQTLTITAADLKARFGINNPRLLVCGLNPHAGEGGHLGWEDDGIIAPAVKAAQALGIDARGPVPADSAFNPGPLADCDVVIAMYHDQGLPVLKHRGFGKGINVTLGLPFIRTSVDHGTALDIAGSGTADAGSLLAAIDAATFMANKARAVR